MQSPSKYIFTSERLGFRNWKKQDLPELVALCADPEVMQHFPSVLSEKESADFLERLIAHYKKYKHSYFAVEKLENGELIGFVGLAYQVYESDFTPATDIGWRLKKSAWGKGYATEGAKRCLKYAFEELALTNLFSTCTIKNKASEQVMKKIGMIKTKEFNHPKLKDFPDLQCCVLYEIELGQSLF